MHFYHKKAEHKWKFMVEIHEFQRCDKLIKFGMKNLY